MLEKVLTGELTFSSLEPCDLSQCTKAEIKAYFVNSYALDESIFTALKDESVFYKCPDRLRLPLIFYYGHTASVYVNKLILADLLKPADRINLEYEALFETGVDEMSWDDTENYRMGGKYRWPAVDDVIDYRRKVKALVLSVIENTPLELPVTFDSPWWAVFMGMEHERIHLETSSVLIRQLPVHLVTCPPGWAYAPLSAKESAGENFMLQVRGTNVSLGKPFNFPSYGWDNEYGHLDCRVPAFEASRYMVTNQQFLDFVLAGGYESLEYWTDEGWKWVNFRQAKHPTFWICDKGCQSGCGGELAHESHCKPSGHMTNGQNSYCNGHSNVDGNGHQGQDEGGGRYRLRCMFSVVDMPWDWPVEVNYHEARAFCKWMGPYFRLPAEAEHHVIRAGLAKKIADVASTDCDIMYTDKMDANFNLQYGSSTPVNFYPSNDRGFYDSFGNAWEWLEDHYNGLPGTKTSVFYDDFSTPTYDGQHNMILGGSWISTGDEASRFARFGFRRHFFQHCGFRLARSLLEDGDRGHTPARLVNTEVYEQGVGIADNPVCVDESKHGYVSVPSSNVQYHQETERSLQRMICAEYGSNASFPRALSLICKNWVEKYKTGHGSFLHVGCGTGRITFELASIFDTTLGQDVCARYVSTCQKLQAGQTLQDTDPDDGQDVTVFVKDGYNDRLTFKTLTWLPNEVTFHDFVLATSFDRMQNAQAWTTRLKEVLKPAGLLVVSSVDKWDEDNLGDILGKWFNMVDTISLATSGRTSRKARVSAWQHK